MYYWMLLGREIRVGLGGPGWQVHDGYELNLATEMLKFGDRNRL